jgi:hypothetical protein
MRTTSTTGTAWRSRSPNWWADAEAEARCWIEQRHITSNDLYWFTDLFDGPNNRFGLKYGDNVTMLRHWDGMDGQRKPTGTLIVLTCSPRSLAASHIVRLTGTPAQRDRHADVRDAPTATAANFEHLPTHIGERAANRFPPSTDTVMAPKGRSLDLRDQRRALDILGGHR